MATITYDWFSVAGSFFLNNLNTGGNQNNPAIAGDAARTRYLAAWDQPAHNFFKRAHCRAIAEHPSLTNSSST